tara:strand:- start:22300 stop:23295 length:996 start_codon:yes stop_codon:yes gene_type:complete
MESQIKKIKYGFYDRLNSKFPSQILMDITEVCNLSCIHCPHPSFRKSEHYQGRFLDPKLNEKMINEVNKYGRGVTQYIRYASNGEPLLHPQSYSMIQNAVEKSGVPVTLTTNGKLMDEKRTKKLLDAGLHLIDISIDAFKPETYSKIRVNGDLKTTQSNVLRLINLSKESKNKTKVVVSFVEQELNSSETSDFENFWNDNGADYVVIRRLHSCSGAKTDLAHKRRKNNSSYERRPCLYPWERIVINARGDLAFCPSDWVHGSLCGSYYENTISETWKSEFYKNLRKAHLENNFNKHSFCGQCPDWKQTRWPNKGRSYANMIEDLIDSDHKI